MHANPTTTTLTRGLPVVLLLMTAAALYGLVLATPARAVARPLIFTTLTVEEAGLRADSGLVSAPGGIEQLFQP